METFAMEMSTLVVASNFVEILKTNKYKPVCVVEASATSVNTFGKCTTSTSSSNSFDNSFLSEREMVLWELC